MKISVLQDQLAKGLSIVSRAVDSRVTLPVLANILLTTEDSRLRLSATNLELSITTYIAAQIDKPGQVTLPAKTFSELVNALAPEKIDLTLDAATDTVNVRCGRTNSHIKGIAAAEFPPIPQTLDPDVVLPGGLLKEMVHQTAFCAAKEDSRPILTGLYTQFDGAKMTMAAADGYRLAVKAADIDMRISPAREFVIPARTLMEVARTIVDDEREVGISLPPDRDLVMFQVENTVITSQLLEGRFPDFSAIIPKAYSTAMTVGTAEFLRDCKRAEIFARDNNNNARFTVKPPKGAGEPGLLMITATSRERGSSENALEAHIEGEPLEVAFNIRYLIDVLNVLAPTDFNVLFESNGAASAGVIRSERDPNFLHVIMPMTNR